MGRGRTAQARIPPVGEPNKGDIGGPHRDSVELLERSNRLAAIRAIRRSLRLPP